MGKLPRIPGYTIKEEIGRGGSAIVYMGIQENLNRPVAIKILKSIPTASKNQYERFLREAKLVSQMRHSNIVTIFDLGIFDNCFCIVMECLESSLRNELDSSGSLPLDEAIGIIKQMAGTLEYAHSKGVIHRDINPANILFREDGAAVLADFGLAFDMDSRSVYTEEGRIMGTRCYMSPEQCLGERGEKASDIYSLGVVLYELLMGKVPYESKTKKGYYFQHIHGPVPEFPPPLMHYQPMLDGMMAKDKTLRFHRGNQVIELINNLEKNKSLGTINIENHVHTVKKNKRKRKQNSLPLMLIVFLFTVFLAIIVSLLSNYVSTPGKNPIAVTKVGQENNDKNTTPGTTRTHLSPGKIFDPTAKRDTMATRTTPPADDTREEQKPPALNNHSQDVKLTPVQPTTTPTSSPTMQINKNNRAQGTTGTKTAIQSTTPKPIEIPTVSLNQLDPDIRANIEAKLKHINLRIDGVFHVIKNGNYQLIIDIDSSGAVKSIDIQGIEVEPKEKMAELKSNLVQRIRSMNFPSPTINGKPVDVKIGINFSKVSKFSSSIILEI